MILQIQDELIRGAKAGADFVLSVNEKNINILDEIKSIPVIIPSKPGDFKSLERVNKKNSKKRKLIFLLIRFWIQFIMVLQIQLKDI